MTTLTEIKVIGCFKCGKKCPLYMVHNNVWNQAWPSYNHDKRRNPDTMLELCFSCLRESLGRPLTIDDFTNVTANEGIRFGFELGLDYALKRIPS